MEDKYNLNLNPTKSDLKEYVKREFHSYTVLAKMLGLQYGTVRNAFSTDQWPSWLNLIKELCVSDISLNLDLSLYIKLPEFGEPEEEPEKELVET